MVRTGRSIILVLLLAGWAAAVFLSSPPPDRLADDVELRPWSPGSFLRPVVVGLSLNHAVPTVPADHVKALALRAGAGLMAVAALVCWGLTIGSAQPGRDRRGLDKALASVGGGRTRRRFSPLVWAMVFLLAWLGWGAASASWSAGPRVSLAWVHALGFVVAVAGVVGVGLDARRTAIAAGGWLVISAALAGLMIWYHFERSPDRPVGMFGLGSRELGGLLLPSMVLAPVLAWTVVTSAIGSGGSRLARLAIPVAALLGCAAMAVWACGYCGRGASQAAAIAAPAGLIVAVLVAGRSRAKTAAAFVVLLCVWTALAWWIIRPAPAASAWNDEELIDGDRWSMACELARHRPVVGSGAGMFPLRADSVAGDRALSDPSWANRPVGHAGSFWLEQLAELGLVGTLLLMGAVALLLAGARESARLCQRRGSRFLLAGLAGATAAMLVHELFASSAAGHAFAFLLAGLAGLTAAAARWSGRAPSGPSPARRSGLHAGGVSFVVGAAIAAAAMGYVVVQDWQAARNCAKARIEPAAAGAMLEQSARWSIDGGRRIDAAWRLALHQLREVAGEIGDAQRAGPPTPTAVSGRWAQQLESVRRSIGQLERVWPDNVARFARYRAWAWELSAQGQLLSRRSRIVVQELVADLRHGRQALDLCIMRRPYDLAAATSRLAAGRPRDLAARLGVTPAEGAELIAAAGLHVAPADQLRLLRDGLRDFGLMQAAGASVAVEDWVGPSRIVPDWPYMATPAAFYDHLALAEASQGGSAAESAGALKRMADAAEAARGLPAGAWADDADRDIMNAPQTFRLLAERALLRNHLLSRAGRPGADLLVRADGYLARAQELYDQRPARFAVQRVIVACQRAQLAWGRASNLPADWPQRQEHFAAAERHCLAARRALTQVVAEHRPAAGRAVAIVGAFLAAEGGRTAEAVAWLDRVGSPKPMSLPQFRDQVAVVWGNWLIPKPAAATSGPEQ